MNRKMRCKARWVVSLIRSKYCLEAETRIQVGISHICQSLCHHSHAHSHHSTGFDQVNVLVEGCFQEEGTKTFVGKEELDHNDTREQPVDLQHNDRKGRHERIAQGMLEDD